LLLVNLLVGLHVVEGLQHCLHQLILGGDQLFEVNIVVGVVVVGIVSLIIAGVVPCVHHLRMFGEGRYTCVRIEMYPETICYDFYLSLFKG
jgi:hypothetical protein